MNGHEGTHPVTNSKVVFLGICSGDEDLIRQWVASGDLPAIARLLEGGLTGHQMGLPGIYVGAHWPSWITGCHPGKNRVHSWMQLEPGTYTQYRCKAGDHMQRRPFWDALSAAGRRLCILDVPHSRISPDINGLQSVEWGAHDAAYGFMASTPEFKKEIEDRFGLHPVSGNSDADRSPAELVAFRDSLIRGVRMKGELTRHYYKQENWDFFTQVFTEAHCGGHLLWHLHDPSYPWHGGSGDASAGDALKDVYRAIDDEIGKFLDLVDDDTTVILLANHGIGAKYNANHLLDRILVELGYAAPKAVPPRQPTVRDRIDPALTWGWRKLPQSLRDRLAPVRDLKRRLVNPEETPPPVIEPSAGRVFTIVNNTAHGAVRVNLQGREPDGRVAPGAEYEALLDDITMDLKGLTNLATGEPIVGAVYRCDDIYPGPERGHLPDLFVQWNEDMSAPVDAAGSNKLPRIEGTYRYVRSGDHRPRGVFAVTGPGLGTGVIDRTVSCVDWAPTICTLLGIAPDADLDGRVIDELMTVRQAAE